jgi:hypothetical protein
MSNPRNDNLIDSFREWLLEREATHTDIYHEKTGWYVYNRLEGKMEAIPEEYIFLCEENK